MKSWFKKTLSLLLVIVMIIVAVPFLKLESKAAVANYSSTAAVEYANSHVYNYNSLWCNYNSVGGDCANFVSQCLYAGGMDMTSTWHCYDSPNSSNDLKMSSYSWVRANELCNYLTSLGGTRITAPSANDISVGDCLFYDWTGDGKMNHSAIVTNVSNGQITIACHSPANARDGRTTNWTFGANPANIRLVKLYGNLCNANNRKDYDGYRVNSYSWVSGGTVSPGWYIHVTETKVTNGVRYGRFNFKGTDSWIPLTSCSYSYHVDSIKVSHIFRGWENIGVPSCVKGYKQQNVCARCGYTETRDVAPTGHTPGEPATCVKAQICTKCGEILNPALGHDFCDWSVTKAATCTEDGTKERSCNRCHITDEQIIDAIGHNYSVQTDALPDCTNDGWMRLKCENCGAEYAVENLDTDGWSEWTTVKNNNVPSEKTESKTQYRYKDKSTRTSESSVLSGWTLYDTTTSWSNWSGPYNQNTKPLESDSLKITKTTPIQYNYYHYCCNWYDGIYNFDSIPYGSGLHYYHTTSSTWAYPTLNIHDMGGKQPYGGTGSGANYCPNNFCAWFLSSIDYSYEYYTRTLKNIYHFYQWSSWSNWNDTAVTATDNKQVETRTVYRYKLSALGHDFQDYGELEVIDSDLNTDGLQFNPEVDECAYAVTECSRCHIKYVDKDNVIGHNWGEPEYPYEDNTDTADIDESEIAVYTCEHGHVKVVMPDHEHNFIKISETEATCTADGEQIWKCDCGETKTVILTALGHDTTDESKWYVAKEATCSTAGVLMKPCVRHADCGYEEEIEIPALGHDYIVKEKLPTCTEKGETITTCSRCDYINREEIPAHEHAMGEWEVEVEATCLPGREIRRCLHTADSEHNADAQWCKCCEYTEEREIPAIGTHEFEHHETSPWCEIAGLKWDECIYCHLVINEEIIPALEHDDIVIDEKAPTCTENGYEKVQCQRCKRILQKDVDKLGHDWNDGELMGKTCTGGEVTLYTCQRDGCGATYFDYAGGGTHNLGDWNILSEPTCTKAGVKTCQCQNMVKDINTGAEYQCPYTETEYIDALGHDYELTSATDATCLTAKTETYTCQREGCGDIINITSGAPLGHDYSGEYTVKKATCLEDGEKCLNCVRVNNGEVCNAELDRIIIPKRSHNMGDWIQVKEATCTKDGENIRYCLNTDETDEYLACSYSESEKAPALGHDFGEWYVVKPATDTETGEERRDCSRCEEYETRDIPMLDNQDHDSTKDSFDFNIIKMIIDFFIDFFEKTFKIKLR